MKEGFYKTDSFKNRIIKITLSLLMLCIGGLIYIVFRDESLLMFDWFENIGISQHIKLFRGIFGTEWMYSWVKYSLPDGLWLIAYMLIIDAIWNGSNSISFYIFIYALPFFALLSEMLQYFGLFSGVFDWIDVICYSLAILLYILIKIIK